MTKWIVHIINNGLYEVATDDETAHVNPALLATYDGEFWTMDIYKDEDEPLPIPADVCADDIGDVMENVVLPYLGLGCDETWMDIA